MFVIGSSAPVLRCGRVVLVVLTRSLNCGQVVVIVSSGASRLTGGCSVALLASVVPTICSSQLRLVLLWSVSSTVPCPSVAGRPLPFLGLVSTVSALSSLSAGLLGCLTMAKLTYLQQCRLRRFGHRLREPQSKYPYPDDDPRYARYESAAKQYTKAGKLRWWAILAKIDPNGRACLVALIWIVALAAIYLPCTISYVHLKLTASTAVPSYACSWAGYCDWYHEGGDDVPHDWRLED